MGAGEAMERMIDWTAEEAAAILANPWNLVFILLGLFLIFIPPLWRKKS